MRKIENILNIKNDFYLISESGEIFSLYKNNFMKYKLDKNSYKVITLRTKDNKQKTISIHKLVALVYLGFPIDMKDPTVDHIDRNKHNNHYANLRWVERGVNVSLAHKTQGYSVKGELHPRSKLTKADVAEIRVLLNKGYSLTQLANKFKVSRSTISSIRRNITWT